MKNKKWYLDIIFLVFALLFLVTIFTEFHSISKFFRIILIPIAILSYFWCSNNKSVVFIIFLIAFFIAEFVNLFRFKNHNINYYLSNTCYALAYISLFKYIVSSINFKRLLTQFTFHLITLIALGSYIFYALDSMIRHHGKNIIPISYYIIESIYNLFVILVLVFSFLQYIYDMNKKSLLLFLASLFLCFSELTQVAYMYIKVERMINIMYSIFLILGFSFTYSYIVSKRYSN